MLKIREMTSQDWQSVSVIYAEGIATRNATFETEVPTWEIWDTGHLTVGRFVAVKDGEISGWTALSGYSSRQVYRGVAQVSVYIAEQARGQGIGKFLLKFLVEESERAGFWTLQSGIFPENTASLALHAKCGFRQVGYRERIGQLDSIWRDVILLERRSHLF
jgi:L-amino acid N-acyltransferase YncA